MNFRTNSRVNFPQNEYSLQDLKVSKIQDLNSHFFTKSAYFMRKIGYLPPIDYKERRARNRQAIRLGDLESYEGCREFYILTEK